MWFDELKAEPQAGNAIIDWRFSGIQQIRTAFAVYIQTPAQATGQTYWLQLSAYTSSNARITCSATSASANATNLNSTSSSNSTTSSTATSTIQGGAASNQTLRSATYASPVSSSSPPPPPVITGTSAQQNAASSVQSSSGGQRTSPNTQTSGLAALIGRKHFFL